MVGTWNKDKALDISTPEDFFQGELLQIARRIADDSESLGYFDSKLLNQSGKEGNTLLMFSLLNKRRQALSALVRLGADATVEVPGLGSPLGLAALSDDPSLLEALLKAGVDPNTRDKSGTPIFFFTVTSGFDAVLDKFLYFGLETDAVDNVGNTAVHEALFAERFDRALRLLETFEHTGWTNRSGHSIEHLTRRFLERTDLTTGKGRTRAAILEKMLGVIQLKNRGVPQQDHVVIRDAHFSALRQIHADTELRNFFTLFDQKEQTKVYGSSAGRYKIDITKDGKSTRYLYDTSGLIRPLAKSQTYDNRIPLWQDFNDLIGAASLTEMHAAGELPPIRHNNIIYLLVCTTQKFFGIPWYRCDIEARTREGLLWRKKAYTHLLNPFKPNDTAALNPTYFHAEFSKIPGKAISGNSGIFPIKWFSVRDGRSKLFRIEPPD